MCVFANLAGFWPAVDRTQEEVWAVDDYEDQKRSTPIRWCDTADENNKTIHSLMQWHSIAPPPIDSRSGAGGTTAPYDGEITLEMMEIVFDILIRHSGEEQECICAIWGGFGNLDHLRGVTRIEGIGQQEHILFNASLGAVRDQWSIVLKHYLEPSGLTPQVIWPTSRDWYYTVPFEMHSSYFGGPDDMAAKIRDASALETYDVFPGDNIWKDDVN